MGLNNIQRSKQKVLNRPMFAKMKDGTIKPVQYHWIGAAINLGSKVAPYVGRYGVKPLYGAAKKGLGYFKPWGWSSGARASGNQIIKEGINKGKKFKDVYPNLYRQGNMPRFNITSTNPANIALQTGATAAPFAYDYLKGDKKDGSLESVMPAPSDRGEGSYGRREQAFDEESAVPKGKKEEKITETLTEDIKSGNMDEMIKDKITLFEKYLGKDVDKRKKSAGYNAMVEFGLNLASARGGNTMDKIARSAKDPLANFAKVGKEIVNRAEQIKMAGIEAGIQSFEKAADRDVELQSIAADKEIQQMKNDATKMDKQQFMLEYSGKLLTDSDALKQVMRPYLDDNGKLPEGTTPQMIVQGTLENVWQSSQPKIITEELITLAQNTPGNEELSREEIIQGYIANGYSLK
mgnify:FL=1